MSPFSAFSVGALNAFVSISDTAMPSALELIALLTALTISPTLLRSEPVHWYVQPSSLQASSAPYFVGTKNGFVVTWLTNVNLNFFWDPKTPAAGDPPWARAAVVPVVDSFFPPPQACRISVARPAAPPVSAVRRDTSRQRLCGVSSCLPSAHSRRSMTSSAASRLRRSTDSWSDTSSSLLDAGPSRAAQRDPPPREDRELGPPAPRRDPRCGRVHCS